MEAKYMRTFEDFESVALGNAKEASVDSLNKKIWDVIDSGDFYCIISAYQPGNDSEILGENHAGLMKDVLQMKYAYMEQSYGYEYSDGTGLTSVKRKSLFVPVMSYQELLALGKKYKQETIAFGGNGGLSVVRVEDEAVVMSMTTEEMRQAFNFLLVSQRNIPWQK